MTMITFGVFESEKSVLRIKCWSTRGSRGSLQRHYLTVTLIGWTWDSNFECSRTLSPWSTIKFDLLQLEKIDKLKKYTRDWVNYCKQWLRRLSNWKDYFAVGNSNVKFGLNSTDPTYTQDKEVKNNPDMHFWSGCMISFEWPGLSERLFEVKLSDD